MRTVKAGSILDIDQTLYADPSVEKGCGWLDVVGQKTPCTGCSFQQHCKTRQTSCEAFNQFVAKGEINENLPRIPKPKYYANLFPPPLRTCELDGCDKQFEIRKQQQRRKFCCKQHQKMAKDRRRLQKMIGTEATCRECYADFVKTGPEQQLCFLCRYTSHYQNGTRNLQVA